MSEYSMMTQGMNCRLSHTLFPAPKPPLAAGDPAFLTIS
jgi:hypothetical protein